MPFIYRFRWVHSLRVNESVVLVCMIIIMAYSICKIQIRNYSCTYIYTMEFPFEVHMHIVNMVDLDIKHRAGATIL